MHRRTALRSIITSVLCAPMLTLDQIVRPDWEEGPSDYIVTIISGVHAKIELPANVDKKTGLVSITIPRGVLANERFMINVRNRVHGDCNVSRRR